MNRVDSFWALVVVLFFSVMPQTVFAHCEIPCGIYDDKLRFSLMREDADTIEKGMRQINELSADVGTNANQLIRWVINKDEHADRIKETVADYFLSQRVKAPEGGDPREEKDFLEELRFLHEITVLAMKCKQTTDLANVSALRASIQGYEELYWKVHGHSHAS